MYLSVLRLSLPVVCQSPKWLTLHVCNCNEVTGGGWWLVGWCYNHCSGLGLGTSIRWLRPTCVPALGLPTRGTDLTRSLEWLTLAEGQSQKNDSPWHDLEASWTNHWWKWTHSFGKVCSTCAIWEKKWRWNKWKRGTQDFFQTSFAQKFLSLSLVPRIYFYLSIQRLVSVSPSK